MTLQSAMIVSIVPMLAAAACGKEPSITAAPPDASSVPLVTATATASTMVWKDFVGVQYQAPSGANATFKDGVMPGPGGQGGIPTGERPSLTLSMAGPKGFYVQLEKPKDAVSLDGMKRVIDGMKMGTNVVTKKTANGWEISYARTDAADAEPPNAHILYFDIAGGHYQCTYADVNCGDPAMADAICRSLRAKVP